MSEIDTVYTKKMRKEIREYLLEEFGGRFSESHKLMAQFNMPMLEGFAKFRRSIQPAKGDPQGALPKHIK